MSYKQFYDQLNEVQRKAVDDVYGAHLVAAGPGTGKTQMLACRTAHIVSTDITANPDNILLLTFTEAAGKAMLERCIKFMGVEAYKVNIFTFHGFCNDIIQSNQAYFGYRDFEPVNELEKISIIREIIDEIPNDSPLKRLKGDIYLDVPRFIDLFWKMKSENWDKKFIKSKGMSFIANLKNNPDYQYKRANKKKNIKVGDPKINDIKDAIDKTQLTMQAASYLDKYNQKLLERKRYDFDDMMGWVVKAFEQDEDFLRRYQERFQYVLLDEFQDTNGIQMRLIHLLLNYWDVPNILTVGDDDQCLYQFNGARIKNILEFGQHYKANIYILKENYRSGQMILNHSKKLIDNNVVRLSNENINIDKTLVSKVNYDYPIEVYEYLDVLEEQHAIIAKITSLLKNNVSPENIGVIYRKHKQAEGIINQLGLMNIPVNVIRRRNILQEPVIHQLITLLRFLQQEEKKPMANFELVFEVLHFPFLNIDRSDLDNLAITLGSKFWTEDYPITHIAKKLRSLSEKRNDLGTPRYVQYVMQNSGYLDYLYKHDFAQQYLIYAYTFLEFVKEQSFKYALYSVDDLINDLDQMNESSLSLTALDINYDNVGVNFMTAHGSKGLEFDHVFIIGATSSEWEKSRARSNSFFLPETITLSPENDNIESNRRLFYVASTRAKKHLHISYANKNKNGKELSRTQFIDEMDLVPHVDQVKHDIRKNIYLDLKDNSINFKHQASEERLRDMLKTYTISISHVNKYLRCPVSFYYENILKAIFVASPDLIFGNAIHKALESTYLNLKLNKEHLSFDQLCDAFIAYLQKNIGQLGQREYEMKSVLGKSVLFGYWKNLLSHNKYTAPEWNSSRIVLKANNIDVPFKGVIDRLDWDGPRVSVIDYKTGKVNHIKSELRPAKDDYIGGDYWRQGISYKLLIDHASNFHNWKFGNCYFDVLSLDFVGRVELEITPMDENIVLNQIADTYKKIQNLQFAPGCGECKWCKMINNR